MQIHVGLEYYYHHASTAGAASEYAQFSSHPLLPSVAFGFPPTDPHLCSLVRHQLFGWFRKRRLKKILAQPWPEKWDLHLNRNVRLCQKLSQNEIQALQDRTKIFVAEKNWEGLEGLDVTVEMKVTIAAQACMMLLGVDDFYFDNVKTILVFPDTFRREANDGVTFGAQHRSGEAWQGGPIVLSWRDALRGCRNEDDGSNVVIHEFAHALDGLDGFMGGNITFDDQPSHDQWDKVVDHGYQELVAAKKSGRRTLLDHYGATNKAEYFAVATETFFEQPGKLRKKHHDLYSLLVKYFKVNPMKWQ